MTWPNFHFRKITLCNFTGGGRDPEPGKGHLSHPGDAEAIWAWAVAPGVADDVDRLQSCSGSILGRKTRRLMGRKKWGKEKQTTSRSLLVNGTFSSLPSRRQADCGQRAGSGGKIRDFEVDYLCDRSLKALPEVSISSISRVGFIGMGLNSMLSLMPSTSVLVEISLLGYSKVF